MYDSFIKSGYKFKLFTKITVFVNDEKLAKIAGVAGGAHARGPWEPGGAHVL